MPNTLANLRRRRQPASCFYCGAESTHIFESALFKRPAPGSGRSRGKREGGVTRRVCYRHAAALLEFLERQPTRRGDVDVQRQSEAVRNQPQGTRRSNASAAA